MGDRAGFVGREIVLSAGETVPDCVRPLSVGALDWARVAEGLAFGGRMECFLRGTLMPGRGKPAIAINDDTQQIQCLEL